MKTFIQLQICTSVWSLILDLPPHPPHLTLEDKVVLDEDNNMQRFSANTRQISEAIFLTQGLQMRLNRAYISQRCKNEHCVPKLTLRKIFRKKQAHREEAYKKQ